MMEQDTDIVTKPLDYINHLLMSYDINTLRQTLHTCNMHLSMLQELSQNLTTLKYAILTDKYDDTIELAKVCEGTLKNLIRANSYYKKNDGFIKTKSGEYNDIIRDIKKRLLDNFMIDNDTHITKYAKLIEILGTGEIHDFLLELANKICLNIPRDRFTQVCDKLLSWIIDFMRNNTHYVLLDPYGIKYYVFICWCHIVCDCIKTDLKNDPNLLSLSNDTFMTFRETYIALVNQYMDKIPKYLEMHNKLFVLDMFDPYYTRLINDYGDSFIKQINIISKLDNIQSSQQMINDIIEKFIITSKLFEDTIKKYKNIRNQEQVFSYYVGSFKKITSEFKIYMLRSSKFMIDDLRFIKEIFIKLAIYGSEIENVYNLCEKNITMLIDNETKDLNTKIQKRYRGEIFNLLISSYIKYRTQNNMNVFNIITRSPDANDKVVDVSENIPTITQLVNEINEYNTNMKNYLLTEIIIFYKEYIDIPNLPNLKPQLFQQILMDVYQIKHDVGDNGLFAEIEGRLKFLSTNINIQNMKESIFVDQFIEFYSVSNIDTLHSIAKYKGMSSDKIENIIKLYKSKLSSITKNKHSAKN